MDYHDSLWVENPRLASPIVDILVALGMQYGNHLTASSGEDLKDCEDDSSIAGYWLFGRCEMLLSQEREFPSLLTVQCHIFCTIYLMNAFLINRANSTLAVAIRTAHRLGLHRTPPNDSPPNRINLLRRTWFHLVFLDSKMSMRLGQPFMIDPSDVAFSLPSVDEDATVAGNTNTLTYEGISFFTFHTLSVKLILTARRVYEALNRKYLEVMGQNSGKDIYDNPSLVEECARSIPQSMKGLKTWALEVPEALQNRRKGSAEPFSTTRGPLDIDHSAPIWLQRQRLLLELLYHNLVMTLHRPFIRFYPGTSFLTPVAAALSNSCINHAAISIDIVDQVQTESDILNSWYQVFYYTWDAALSSIGFALAHPICPFTPTARRSMHTAIVCFNAFDAQSVAAAKSAAESTRSFNSILDKLATNLRGSARPLADSSSDLTPRIETPRDLLPSSTGSPPSKFPASQTLFGLQSIEGMDVFSMNTTAPDILSSPDASSDMFNLFDDMSWLGDTGMVEMPNIWPD
jgi:hypothetical protein